MTLALLAHGDFGVIANTAARPLSTPAALTLAGGAGALASYTAGGLHRLVLLDAGMAVTGEVTAPVVGFDVEAAHRLILVDDVILWVVESEGVGEVRTVSVDGGLSVSAASSVPLVLASGQRGGEHRGAGITLLPEGDVVQEWTTTGPGATYAVPSGWDTNTVVTDSAGTVHVSALAGSSPAVATLDGTPVASSSVVPFWTGGAAPGEGGWHWLADGYGAAWQINLHGPDGTVIASESPAPDREAHAPWFLTQTPAGMVGVPFLDQFQPPYNGRPLFVLANPDSPEPLQTLDLTIPSSGEGTWAPWFDITAQASYRDGIVTVVSAYYRDGATLEDRDWHLRAWSVRVPLPTHGRLSIDTLTDEFWVVGTRDPAMRHRLWIDLPDKWLCEIFAGEEPLATHRLLVDNWPHEDELVECALMRPAD